MTKYVFGLVFFLALGSTALAEAGDDTSIKTGTDVGQEQYFQKDRGQLRLGAFFVNDISTRIRIDSQNGPLGTSLDMEQDLGLRASEIVPRISLSYRVKGKHRFDFGWFDLKREGTRVIDKEIKFGPITIPINAEVESFIDTEIYKLKYTYLFFEHPKVSLGIGGGIHFSDIDIGLKTTGTPEVIQAEVGGLAPLPLIGFTLAYRITPKLIFAARFDQFFLDYSKYRGTMIDTSLAIEWRAFRRIGFGFGWDKLAFDIQMDDDDLRGEFTNTYGGFLFYTAVYF